MNIDVFTTREIATVIWICIIFSILLFQKQTRASIINVIKTALHKKVFFYFLTYLCYLSLITYLLFYLELWDISNLKDSVIWFIFSGLPIGVTVATTKLEVDFWKNVILDNLKLIAFVAFIISSFTFSLIIEFVLLPIITFIVLLNTFAKRAEIYKPAEKITNAVLVGFGIFLLSYSLYRALNEIYVIGNINTLKNFMIPVVFSVISIPYMYTFKLYVEYEQLFIKLKFGKNRTLGLNLLIKLRLLLFCNIQFNKLQIAMNMGNYNIMLISSSADINDMLQTYKKIMSSEKIVSSK